MPFLRAENPRAHVNTTILLVAVVNLSQTASIWRGLFRKERQPVLKFLLQERPLPPRLIPAQHRGIPTILQCPQEVCAMVGHSWGSDHDLECMAILCLQNRLHLANIVTVQRRVRDYNDRKLFARNMRNASEYLRRESTTIERTTHPTYVSRSFSEGHVSSIDEYDWHSECVLRSYAEGCILSFDERNRHSKRFPRSYTEAGLHFVVWRVRLTFRKNSKVICWGLHIIVWGAQLSFKGFPTFFLIFVK